MPRPNRNPLRDSNAKIHPLAWTGPTKGATMATSLYDLSVPTFLQTVRAVAGFLQRAAKHCAKTGADPDDFGADRGDAFRRAAGVDRRGDSGAGGAHARQGQWLGRQGAE